MQPTRPLDRIDFEILSTLRNNARIANKDLAEKVGLAPSSCLERTRYLQAIGIISGFHADLDMRQLGVSLQAMVAVRLTKHSREFVESFRTHLLALPEVLHLFHLSGANDFMVHVGVSNADKLRDFVLSAFTEREEVAHIETAVIYEQAQSWQLPRTEIV